MNKMLWAALLAAVGAACAWAHQPSPVDVTMESIPARLGNSYLRLKNQTRESQTLTIAVGPGGTAQFRSGERIVLSSQMTLDVNLGDLQLKDGIEVLHVVTTVELNNGGTVEGPVLYDVLEVTAKGVTKTTYERAFLSRRVAVDVAESEPLRVDLGGGYIDAQPMARLAFPAEPVAKDERIEPVDGMDVMEMSNMRLKQLPEDGTAAGPQLSTRMARGAARDAGIFGSIKGVFTVRVPGPNGPVVQGAWGWKVRVWQILGNKAYQVASANVAQDGNWSADFVIMPFPGFPVRVEYQPANRFMQVQDAQGDIYTWVDKRDVTGTVTDVGTSMANLTQTMSAPGIDRIYQGGMALWRKFKKFGMNALRDKPIEITYPNTLSTGKCQNQQNGMAIAWSCSQFADGKIWMIAQHALPRVVQHELTHSIHSYYWNGNMPAGSGIQHDRTLCYNPGLALSEGYATFVAYWVQFDRGTATPKLSSGGYSINIETLGNGFCLGASNESQVAATLWDVYDTVNDGPAAFNDSWNFTHEYAPVSILLKNPGHNSMMEYANVYTTILGNNWATAVTNLFLFNTMYLP